MELRKIQKTGGGTYLVSLPKNWAERKGLDRGSLVAISERANGRLTIDHQYNVEKVPQVATIKPTPYLNREIIGMYLLGNDIVRVEAKERISLNDREQVKQSSTRLIGLEIIEEDYSKIVMQCLLEPSAFPPEKIFLRESSIASSMHQDAVTALIEGNVNLAKNVVARDDDVDRLYFLLVRIIRTVIQKPHLSEKLGILPIDCLDYRLAASLVELIGDQSTQIAENAIKLEGVKMSKELSQQFINFHRIAYESHKDAVRALFARDLSLAESIKTRREKAINILHEVEAFVHSQPIKFSQYIIAAASSIERIYDYSVDIADLGMPRPP
jgi:phosphate uptake regulator